MMRARRLTLTVLGVLAGGLVFSSAPALATTVHVFSSSFGSATSTPPDPAPLSAPSGVAVNDSTGDVYVVDKGNNRVERFSSTGSYLGYFNGSGTFEVEGAVETGKPAPPRPLESPEGVAVDNDLSSPSVGDVYVVDTHNNVIDKFSGTGEYLGQLTETPTGMFSGLIGVTVDPSGDVWVYNKNAEEKGEAFEFNDLGVYLFGFPTKLGASPGIAVDSEDNLYLVRGSPYIAMFNKVGTKLIEAVNSCECTTGVAIDQATNELLVDQQGSSIAEYDPFGGPLAEEFGSAQLTSGGGSGIAVNPANDTVYVAESVGNVVDSFAGIVLPDVTTGSPATTATASSLTLTGTVNPLGTEEASYYFEYGETTAYGSYAPAPPGTPVSGSEPIQASATVTGLSNVPNLSSYQYRLDATNKSGLIDYGQDQAVTYAVTPAVDDQPATVTDVGRASAVFQGTVNPENSDTFYHFAYVPAGEYQPGASNPYAGGGATADVNAGEGPVDGTVGPVQAGDLLPGTTYHYALVASNTAGSSIGEDHTFTTTPGARPVATTGGASAISQNAATLSGTVSTNGRPTSYGFEIGTEAGNYGPATGLGSLGGALTETVKVTLGELQPGTTYHYRVAATNSDGASYGAEETFTTPGFPVLLTAPAAPSLLAIPSIAFPTETGTTTITTTKELMRAQKLAAALKACRKKSKGKRAGCEKRARKQYAPAKVEARKSTTSSIN